MNNIIPKGIGRSGTTLLRMVLMDLFNTEFLPLGFVSDNYRCIIDNSKCHEYGHINKGDICFLAVRDIRDVIVSRIRTNSDLASNSIITPEQLFKELDNQSELQRQLKHFSRFIDNYNPILVRYENVDNNINHIFDLVEENLNVVINEETKKIINKKHCKEAVMERQHKLKNFSEWEHHYMVHGHHISKNKTDWKNLIPKELHKEMNPILDPYLKKLGYEI